MLDEPPEYIVDVISTSGKMIVDGTTIALSDVP
jgi:hypothetical protein